MVQIDEAELALLFQQGVQGNASSFVLLARRLVSRLKKSDPGAAIILAETLSATPSATRSVTQPVDADSRRGLLKEETTVVLDHEPIWSPEIASKLGRVIEERRLATKRTLNRRAFIKSPTTKSSVNSDAAKRVSQARPKRIRENSKRFARGR